MKKPFKISLWILGAVIFLLFAALLGVKLLVNPNDFKSKIADWVAGHTGRTLAMPGELNIALFPMPTLKIGKMTLSNAVGFAGKDFAELADAEVQVKWLPLLDRKVELSQIVLRGVVLNLATNQQGESNWTDLLKRAESQVGTSLTDAKPRMAADAKNLGISKLWVEQGRIFWEDLRSGRKIAVNDIQMNANNVAFDQPVAIKMDFNVDAGQLHKVNLTTQLFLDNQQDIFRVNALDANMLSMGDKIPSGRLMSSGSLATLEYSQKEQALKIEGLRLGLQNLVVQMNASGTLLKDHLDLQGTMQIMPFDIKAFLQQQQVAVPSMQDPATLTSFTADVLWHATDHAVTLNNLNAKLDQTTLKGTAALVDFQKPVITLSAELDSVNVDRYFPPNANIPTPLLSSAMVLAATDPSLQPFESLKKFSLNSKVSIRQLKMKHLDMQDVRLGLQGNASAFQTQQSIGQLYQGSYQGNASLVMLDNLPHLNIDAAFHSLNLEPFLTALKIESPITGVINATARLNAQGNSTKALTSSLAGELQFQAENGAVKGVNFQKILDEATSLINDQPLPTQFKAEQSLFSELKGAASIKQGVIENHDLTVYAPKFVVNGEGNIDLNTASCAYQLKAHLSNAATPIKALNDLPVTIKIDGSLEKPNMRVQGLSALIDKNKAKIEQKKTELLEKLDNTLKKQLGIGTSELLKKVF